MKDLTSPSPRRSAFTLIELLVVIAIIAILAAILFPVFARARDKARQAACMSNEKQIAVALMMYSQDSDETLPERYGSGNPADFENGKQRSWKNMLYPYIKSYAVFKCPSNPAAEEPDILGLGNPNQVGVFAGGYSMWLPDEFLCSKFGHGCAWPQPLAGINEPANSLIILETSWRTPDVGPYQGYAEPAQKAPDMAAGPSTWNSGHSKNRGNVIYMDGHVKFIYLSKTFDEAGGDSLNQWRFNQKIADDNGLGWLFTLRDQLKLYKND